MTSSFTLIILIVLLWFFIKPKKNKLGIDGKLIWTDHGKNTKPFFNQEFYIVGKPDLLFKTPKGVLAVEYKSRKKFIYQSDIIQAKTAALCARGHGYKVTRILVKTQTQERYIDLPTNDNELYFQIEKYIHFVRLAKNKQTVPSYPSVKKCKSCAYFTPCNKKVVF